MCNCIAPPITTAGAIQVTYLGHGRKRRTNSTFFLPLTSDNIDGFPFFSRKNDRNSFLSTNDWITTSSFSFLDLVSQVWCQKFIWGHLITWAPNNYSESLSRLRNLICVTQKSTLTVLFCFGVHWYMTEYHPGSMTVLTQKSLDLSAQTRSRTWANPSAYLDWKFWERAATFCWIFVRDEKSRVAVTCKQCERAKTSRVLN